MLKITFTFSFYVTLFLTKNRTLYITNGSNRGKKLTIHFYIVLQILDVTFFSFSLLLGYSKGLHLIPNNPDEKVLAKQ